MIYEIHYIKKVEAEDFFEAVEKAKEQRKDMDEVISVCPYIEDMIEEELEN